MLLLAIWRKANPSPVCFGARNNQYGSFKAPVSGRVIAVKLVHLYGFVTCHKFNPNYWSFWGCGHGLVDLVNVVITTSSNNIFLPPSQFMKFAHSAGKWAKVPGYNSFSPEIVLSRFSTAFYVHAGHSLRLWYGEDLVNYTEGDNDGRVCADVYLLYH